MGQQGYISLGSRGQSVPLPSAVCRGYLYSLLVAPSSVFKTSCAASLSPSLALILLPSSLTYTGPSDYIRSVQDFVTSSELFLPCKAGGLGRGHLLRATLLCTTLLSVSSKPWPAAVQPCHSILPLIDSCVSLTRCGLFGSSRVETVIGFDSLSSEHRISPQYLFLNNNNKKLPPWLLSAHLPSADPSVRSNGPVRCIGGTRRPEQGIPSPKATRS